MNTALQNFASHSFSNYASKNIRVDEDRNGIFCKVPDVSGNWYTVRCMESKKLYTQIIALAPNFPLISIAIILISFRHTGTKSTKSRLQLLRLPRLPKPASLAMVWFANSETVGL